MSGDYPPGCTQWHVDHYAGADDPPPEEVEDEPDYDAELGWLSLLEAVR